VNVTNTLLNKSFRVDFNPMATVRKLKTEIEKISGIPWQKQTLVYRDSFVLDDDTQMIETLKFPWRISVLVSQSFQYISIKDKSNNTVFIMEVDFNANISTILDRIDVNSYEKRACQSLARVLLFHGKLLEPDRKISSYQILRGDEIQLDRYNPDGYPRKVYIETGGKYKKGVRVGPFFCDPHTSIYDLKVRFINTTNSPNGKYRLFCTYNELKDYLTMRELDLRDEETLRVEMPDDPLYHMKPKHIVRIVPKGSGQSKHLATASATVSRPAAEEPSAESAQPEQSND
jgi:hypothetical protein